MGECRWTVIYYDGNEYQYSYVEGDEFEEIDFLAIAKGTQNVDWSDDGQLEDIAGVLEADDAIICWMPDFVAVSFP